MNSNTILFDNIMETDTNLISLTKVDGETINDFMSPHTIYFSSRRSRSLNVIF